MDRNAGWNSALDTVRLLRAALHSTVPDREELAAMDLPNVYRVACAHSVQATVYPALERAAAVYGRESLCISDDLFSAWREERSRSVRRSLVFDSERKKLFSFMDQKGIWYMPLKGILLQDLYPKLGMRQMSDNDVLFDRSYRTELRAFMEQNGYTVTRFGKPVHDSYVKKPFLHFELHVELMHDSEDSPCTIYRSLPEGLLRLAEDRCEYRFTPEDFYVYLLLHAKKHVDAGGVGLRTMADVYLFLKRYDDGLSMATVRRALSELGLEAFEEELRTLSDLLFAAEPFLPDSFTDKQKERLSFYFRSGTYGSVANIIDRELGEGQKRSKFSYVMHRLFPSMEYYEYNYPFLHKHKLFIPFFLVYRFFRGITVKLKKNLREFRLLIKK